MITSSLSAKYVNISGFTPNALPDQKAQIYVDFSGGGLLVKPPDLNKNYDSVESWDSASVVVSNTSIGAGTGTVFEQDLTRRVFFLQNLAVTPLYVKFGSGANPNSFNLVLKSGTVQDDGNGGLFSSTQWKGVVSVSGAGTRYAYWQLL